MSKADIVYILDSSGSEGRTQFNGIKEFVANLTGILFQSSLDMKVAAIKFSTFVSEEFKLNTYTDSKRIISAIRNISYSIGSSHINTALLYARQHILTANQGARPDSKKIAIVLTDGQSNDVADTRKQALQLQAVANVITVGIGATVNDAELIYMASNNVTLAPDLNLIYKSVIEILKNHNNPYC